MKKIYFLFLLVLLISCSKKTVQQEDKNVLPIAGFDVSNEGIFYVIFYDNKIYYIDDMEKRYTILPADSYSLDSDGYYKLKIDESLTSYDSNELVLIGGKYFSGIFSNFLNDGDNDYYNFDESGGSYHYRNIKKISSSKYFSEYINNKLIEYKPENLYSTYLADCSCHLYVWNKKSIPWVEGESDAGIGSTIEIEYNAPIKVLSILNGFVDMDNLKLFKENNRPKTMTVIDTENKREFDINIPDYVYFSDIVFEKPTKHVKMIIKDVYGGSKYNDTCITALVDRENDQTKNDYYLELLNTAIKGYEFF